MEAMRTFVRRAGLSHKHSRRIFDTVRSLSSGAPYDAAFSLTAGRSRSGLLVAAEPSSVLDETPAPITTAAELSSSSTPTGFVIPSASSTATTSAPSSSSSSATPSLGFAESATPFVVLGSAASKACGTASSSPATPFDVIDSAASKACDAAPSSSATPFGVIRCAGSKARATAPSSSVTLLGLFHSASGKASATRPSSSTASSDYAYGMRRPPPRSPGCPFGISSSARTYSTSSSPSDIIYAQGMFDDVNDGKWTPFQFASENCPIKTVKLVGDKLDKEYPVLTEVGGKGLFRSLFLLIEKINKHGYSFRHLTLSQLMVDKYGQFVIANGAHLVKSNRRNISYSYYNSAAIFESIIRYSCGRAVAIPPEFRDLLQTLRKRRIPHGYFMLVHPSLMPLHSLSQAYLDVYDYVKNILPNEMATEVVNSLYPSAKFWAEILQSNELLQEWFSHKSCSRFNTKRAWDLFTYLRNVHSHSLSYQGTLRYTKDDVRLIVQCKFVRVMSTLYWKLWQKKVLAGIESETYFCTPGGACCPKPGFCLRRELRLMVKPREVDEMMTAPREEGLKATEKTTVTAPGRGE